MLIGSPFGGLIEDLEVRIRAEARAGAQEAIPEIRFEVEQAVRPLVISAIVVGAFGALVGGIALWRTFR